MTNVNPLLSHLASDHNKTTHCPPKEPCLDGELPSNKPSYSLHTLFLTLLNFLHKIMHKFSQTTPSLGMPATTQGISPLIPKFYYNNFAQIRGYLGLSELVTEKALERVGFSNSHRNLVLLAWGEDAEARFWPRLGLEVAPTAMPCTIEFFDVQSAWKEIVYGTPVGAQGVKSTLEHAIKTSLFIEEDEVSELSLHNAGNDAYWTMRVFLYVMERYLEDNELATAPCGIEDKWNTDPLFVCVDFEAWALNGKTNDPGRWQEAGITILDSRDLHDKSFSIAPKQLNSYHFLNSLYEQQLKNAGGFDNAIKACFRGKCRPYDFHFGTSFEIHQDVTPEIIQSFFRIPDDEDMAVEELIEDRVSSLVSSSKNKKATIEEAEALMGNGFGLGNKKAQLPVLNLPPAPPTPLIEDSYPPLAWRKLPPSSRRVPNFDDKVYYDVNNSGVTEGLIYFDDNSKLTSKTRWIKAMIKKAEADGRFTKQITAEIDAVLARITILAKIPSMMDEFTDIPLSSPTSETMGEHRDSIAMRDFSEATTYAPSTVAAKEVERGSPPSSGASTVGSRSSMSTWDEKPRRPRVRFSGTQQMEYRMDVRKPVVEKRGVLQTINIGVRKSLGCCLLLLG